MTRKIRTLGETCPECERRDALSVWTDALETERVVETWLACDFCCYDERDES
jgi:Zn ribbon nucleic-acid-binding protein